MFSDAPSLFNVIIVVKYAWYYELSLSFTLLGCVESKNGKVFGFSFDLLVGYSANT